MPGLIRQVPRMLLDPLGPLAIRWSYLPQLLPWLWRFWRAGTRPRVRTITGSLAALVGRAWQDWDNVIAAARIGDLFVRNGALFVYATEDGFRSADEEWALRRSHGVRADEIDAAAIRALEPALSPRFQRGYFVSDWGHVVDPHRVVARLADHLRAIGGNVRVSRVRDIRFTDGRPAAVVLDGGEMLPFDALAICGGAWSRALCRRVAGDVPLDTERGYNTTLPNPGARLSRPVCPAESSFLMTPMAEGLRIGGAVELAGLDAPPNFARAKALLELGRQALPGLNTHGGREWMGFRPSMPDSLPVISLAPRHANVALAFGHGHLGLTEAATTGRLVAEMLSGAPTVIDVSPFRVDRF
jgi:glycine/D-amino acid oxidase-like deaminating enzyme